VGKNVVLGGFIQSLPRPVTRDETGEERVARHISLSDIPWYGWRRTLSFWLPVILALWLALIGLAVVAHRQWSDHEQLPYPIAQFADSLLPDEGKSKGGVFSDNLFWLGAVVIAAIHLNNYACQWFDLVRIPTRFGLDFLGQVFPTLGFLDAHGVDHVQAVLRPPLFFTAIAFAYLLASDVSLSVGIGAYLFAFVLALFWIVTGTSLTTGGMLAPKVTNFLPFGAYVGMFITMIYTGRHYYYHVFRRAALLRWGEKADIGPVWAARAFVIGTAIFMAILSPSDWIGSWRSSSRWAWSLSLR